MTDESTAMKRTKVAFKIATRAAECIRIEALMKHSWGLPHHYDNEILLTAFKVMGAAFEILSRIAQQCNVLVVIPRSF